MCEEDTNLSKDDYIVVDEEGDTRKIFGITIFSSYEECLKEVRNFISEDTDRGPFFICRPIAKIGVRKEPVPIDIEVFLHAGPSEKGASTAD